MGFFGSWASLAFSSYYICGLLYVIKKPLCRPITWLTFRRNLC